MTDRIHIRDLEIECIIGIQPKERVAKQTVCINIAMACDLSIAASSDRIEDTVDYKDLKDRLLDLVGASDYFLIECMAERIASECLLDARICSVNVIVDKPGALTGARSVAVEITRSRQS
jgi:FolB domain-containing protein